MKMRSRFFPSCTPREATSSFKEKCLKFGSNSLSSRPVVKVLAGPSCSLSDMPGAYFLVAL